MSQKTVSAMRDAIISAIDLSDSIDVEKRTAIRDALIKALALVNQLDPEGFIPIRLYGQS